MTDPRDADHRLVTYGTLSPGRSNAHQLVGLRGDWTQGTVRGRMATHGWGPAHGYPAIILDDDAGDVPVHVLSPDPFMTAPSWLAGGSVTDAGDADHRLATYGTLSPGRRNARQLASLHGDWTEGTVRGRMATHGWGPAHGYPAIILDDAAGDVPVHVLTSADLPAHWARLDAFRAKATGGKLCVS